MCHPSQTPILQGSCTIAEIEMYKQLQRKTQTPRSATLANHSPYVISNAHMVYEYVTSTSNLQSERHRSMETYERTNTTSQSEAAQVKQN